MLGGYARQPNGLGSTTTTLQPMTDYVDSAWSWLADNIASMSSEAPPGTSFSDIMGTPLSDSITGANPAPPAMLPPAAPQTQQDMTSNTFTPATAANLALQQSQQNWMNFMNSLAANKNQNTPTINWQWVALGGVGLFLAAREFHII